MKTAGIICEYNPLHDGHVLHMRETREKLGEDCGIVCAMSGNFVQRGSFAVFEKHARAHAAVLCGADLVVELPTAVSLSSAQRYAEGAVRILDMLGVCTHLSFGSECGDLDALAAAAGCLRSAEADGILKAWLEKGVSYAAARQKAADKLLGPGAEVLKTPNNILAVEYLSALISAGSSMTPLTVTRTGGEHDGYAGLSASAVRSLLLTGEYAWDNVPAEAARIFEDEVASGRGPVSGELCEEAVLAVLLRMSKNDYVNLPDAGEGLGERLYRFVVTEPTTADVLMQAKTKRYAFSRLRRMMMCAYLGITAADIGAPPAYIKVLAMNGHGREILRGAAEKCPVPIITKPASALSMAESVTDAFVREAKMTDLYVLAFPDARQRAGGQEFRNSPIVV